jgi:hypothetical protein
MTELSVAGDWTIKRGAWPVEGNLQGFVLMQEFLWCSSQHHISNTP